MNSQLCPLIDDLFIYVLGGWGHSLRLVYTSSTLAQKAPKRTKPYVVYSLGRVKFSQRTFNKSEE